MNSLTELQQIVQSMRQGITDNDIHAFQNEISRLEYSFKNETILIPFFKMMRALGKYLGSKKNNAHADSIPTLNSLVQKLDEITRQPKLDPEETHQILSEEIQNYRVLKNKIASKPLVDDPDLNDLKAVILAIDWEISDETLQNFEDVVSRLMSKLQSQKIYHTLLKIIHSTGRFIGSQKANAPTESIPFLRAAFDDFEHIARNPGMEIKDKKKIIESAIKRFQEFKQHISQIKRTPPVPTLPDKDEDEIQPALSHIKASDETSSDDFMPLTTMPENENLYSAEGHSDRQSAAPAAENKNIRPPAPKDIMDDLFTVKESPADELLDAIHLMDVNESNQDQAMNMLDQTSGLASEGTQNFTPQRKDTTPIPEIEDRLDEFFSLDIPGEPSIENTTVQEAIPEEETIPETFQEERLQEESITTFPDTDEPVKADTPGVNAEKPVSEPPESIILNRLKSTIEDSEWIRYDASMLSINEDISYLQECWKNDPEKTCLLNIIASTTHRVKNHSEKTGANRKDKARNVNKAETTGIWGKIKGLFTS